MPIYMDLHILPGVKAKDVAEAHKKDLLVQDEHGCKAMTYWIDEKRGNVFCLIEAPGKEAVEEMHGKAHGLVPNRIIEVDPMLVESFLGRINDPEEAVTSEDGLKVFCDPSFRILLVTSNDDPVLMQHHLGIEKTKELLSLHNDIIRKELASHGGMEVEHERTGIYCLIYVCRQSGFVCFSYPECNFSSRFGCCRFQDGAQCRRTCCKKRKIVWGHRTICRTHVCDCQKFADRYCFSCKRTGIKRLFSK